MTQEGQIPPPPVLWAQRKDILYVTICLEDCQEKELKIEPEMIYFKGVGGTDKKMHQITINLYAEINPDKIVQNHGGRSIELVLMKKEYGPYWPRLTKEKIKAHWLKSDFNKWKDEDESDSEQANEPQNLEEMMKQMGNLGNLGNSANSKPVFKDIPNWREQDHDETDSDDEELPWLFD